MDFSSHEWRCGCCGKIIRGLPLDVGFAAPDGWAELAGKIKHGSCLDDDFCLIRHSHEQADRFIRCVLPIPLENHDEEFCFGVWMSVSEKSWETYRAGFNSGNHAVPGCFGYLANSIPLHPQSYLLRANILFQPAGLRPRVALQRCDHPLYEAQQRGVNSDWVEAILSRLSLHFQVSE